MKLTVFTKLLVLGLIFTVAASGCRKRPGSITPLPGHVGSNVPDSSAPPISDSNNPLSKVDSTAGGITSNDPNSHVGWAQDHDTFKSDTVHFDFDSSVVKGSEKSKVAAVADYLK